MTVTTAAVRPRILAELARRPGQSTHELAAALGYGKPDSSRVAKIVTRMWERGDLAAGTTFRPLQGRTVRIFAIPLEPQRRPPRPAAPGQAERARARNRTNQARSRARRQGRAITPSAGRRIRITRPAASLGRATAAVAACRTADPGLFFSPDNELSSRRETQRQRDRRIARARAVCFSCPIRARCLQVAETNRERYGVWGGVDFETKQWTAASPRTPQTAQPDVAASGRA
jgi:hypothetical protein